ncbi:AtpZ/AtpI family protein [Gracilibacillus boraciitolerans]|nr:AtpZ/AtpI family protein [Gracilibacillus boraciitolerans]
MAIYSMILSQIVGGPLVGLFLGRLVDNYFFTTPLFLVIGLFLGIGAGLYGIIHYVTEITGDE